MLDQHAYLHSHQRRLSQSRCKCYFTYARGLIYSGERVALTSLLYRSCLELKKKKKESRRWKMKSLQVLKEFERAAFPLRYISIPRC